MCGIAGFLAFDGSAANDASSQAIQKMTRLMVRRGPDDEGFWSDPEKGVYFGFRRLSILDLSSAGHQPMVSHDGRSVIVFNGEIYNFKEIRHELEGKGVRFRSQSDTEVLLEALNCWGEEAISKLNGMFSFGWYDRKHRRLILARDHAGIKPLYYFIHPQTKGIAFASQLNVLLHTPWGEPGPIDLSVLHLYLKLHYIPAPYGFYKNTYQLEPGYYLTVDDRGNVQNKPWWQMPKNPEPDLSGEKAVSAVEEALDNALRRQKIADVPLGVFLSGGIDSPLVAAALQKESDKKVKAFTISNPGWAQDETEDAKRYAEAIGLEHRVKTISEAEITALFTSVSKAQYEPFADYSIFPTMLVSQFAKNEVTVALSGDGGDELFFGYERPLSLLKDGRLFQWPQIVRKSLYGFGKLGIGPKRSSVIVAKSPGDYYLEVNSRFKEIDIKKIFPELPPLPQSFQLYKSAPYRDDRGLANYSRYVEYYGQMQRCLKKVDMASMYNSLEVRVPLLDLEVIKASLRIDPMEGMKNRERKITLKRLLRKRIPENLISNTKRGFGIPLEKWLKGPLKSSFEETVFSKKDSLDGLIDKKQLRCFWQEHQSGQRDLKWALWTLNSLAFETHT